MMSEWMNFLLLFTRVVSFFVLLPFMSYRGIPNLIKIFFGLVVSYLLFLSSGPGYVGEVLGPLQMVLLIGFEVFVGLMIGFIVLLFFATFTMAGQFADIKIGLLMAGIFNPQFGSSVTLIAQFYYLFALVIYFTLNGHHYLFIALSQSVELIPLGGGAFSDLTVKLVMELFYRLFTMGFQIAAPILGTIVITDIALGLVSKTVPQLQVFIVGLPLKIFLGLLVVYLTLPFLAPVMQSVFDSMYSDIITIMESLT